MNAFRTDQHVSPLSELGAPTAINKICGDALCVLVETNVASASNNVLFTNAELKRIEQRHLKIATVDRELGLVVAGKSAEWFSKNALAEAIEEHRFFRRHRNFFEGAQEIKRR